MAQICSFCKREVTNNVCCDYCGTPVIFSDFDIQDEKKDINDTLENNIQENNTQENIIQENIIQPTVKATDNVIESLYNEQNYESKTDASEDDIKINIYNKTQGNKESFDGDTTKVISIADIKKALEDAKAKEDISNSFEENIKDDDRQVSYEAQEENIEYTEGTTDENEIECENQDGDLENDQSTDTKYQADQFEDDVQENTENSIMYNIHNKNTALQKEPYKGDTKLIKFLKNTLGIMFLVGFVSLFFPALSPTELTDSLSFSIIDIVLLIATFIGICLSFFEKNGIRKFIYGLIFSALFLAANILVVRPFPPKNLKELIVIIYLLVMLVISLWGHMSDRHTALQKAKIWFDSFNYVAFFINLFAIALSAMIWIVMPDNMIEGIKPYLIALIAICVVSVIGIFLMFKRKIAGANIYMLSSILIIIFSMIAYHNLMNVIGYYNSVISLMNVIGGYYSKFIALLVAFPIMMYAAVSYLNKKQEK